ncbi:DUF4145 domain-containing protein [Melittangium boletus]|uniref:DUF4145 domain-containing protein n=1 Tax=Melittangium boletus TaxID=83453 RepID=UPI003DA2466F
MFYWSDPGAAANRIRTSVERLMDHLAIPPMSTLDRRIKAYQAAEPELGEHLMAIKWLGNSGSHGAEGMTKEDVLDALPLLDHVLGEVFEKRTQQLNRLREKLLEKHAPKRKEKAPAIAAVSSPKKAE